MKFLEALKFQNLAINGIQSVDEMTIYPIVGPGHDDIAPPEALKFRKTSNYGTMVFENEDTKPAIVPANIMARGPAAQDHAMSGAGIVIKSSKSFNTACCIQQRQGGLLSDKDIEHDILPIGLRKAFLDPKFRNQNNMSRLWPSIESWLSGLNLRERGAAHLRYFYGDPEVKKRLEDFAAEFEPIQNQTGAVILFCGIPVGIEIMPSAQHWMSYWKYLIRGCYGAELLRLKMLGKLKSSTMKLPKIKDNSTPDDVEKIMNEYIADSVKSIIPVIDSFNVISKTLIMSESAMKVELLKVDRGGGDLITKSNTPVYLSVVL